MKRIAIPAITFGGLFLGLTLIMTGRDLDAIYTYLSAIPSATPGTCSGAGQ
jgi:hypothetical protein